jgi:phage-related protein
MAYSAGTAFLEIVPSFRNVESLVAKGARDIAKSLDKSLGAQLGKSFQNAARDSERDTARAGQIIGKTFADNAMKHVNSAIANIAESDRVLKPLRNDLIAISEIDISKNFDEKGFIGKVERAHDALRKAQQDAQGQNAVGRFTNAGNAASELGAVKDIVEAARKRGFVAGDAYSDAYLSRLKAMDRSLPDLLTRQGSSPEQREIAAIKSRIQDAMKLAIGQVVTADNNPLNLKIGTKISGEDLKRELGTLEGQLDQFTERAGTIELVVAADKARQQAAGFIKDVQTQEERANEDASKTYLKDWDAAFAEQARRERQARQDLNNSHESAIAEDYKRQRAQQDKFNQQWDQAVAEDHKRLRTEQDKFNQQWDQAIAEDYRRQLAARDKFSQQWDKAVAEDHKRQRAQQDAFLKQWDQAIAESARRQKTANDEIAKERERAFRQTVGGDVSQRAGQAAERITDIPVHLQANAIDREMAAIRARIKALGDIKLGVDVDVDVETFANRVEREFVRLRQIAHDQRVDIDVQVNAARAATELGGILVLLHRIDHDKAEVKVDADGATAGLRGLAQELSLNLGRLGALVALGSSIGTALVPAAAAAAASVGFIGTAALAAGSGIGVLALAFSGVLPAIKALGQYADSQAKSNVALSRSAAQVAGAQQQIQSAEMSLANTRRNNAEAAIKAQRAIRRAIEDQRDAVIDVARANRDALRSVTDAQQKLTEANREDIDARSKLNDAYLEAKRALAELQSQIRGNALDQRQAILDIKKAKLELDKLLANPRATLAEREQADITYQERLLQMEDLKRKGAELAEDQVKQNKKGIEGSDQVVKAKQDIARADKARLDAQRALTRAQEDLVRTQLDGSKKLRDADQKVADARAAAAGQQKDAAYAEYTAMQSLVSARRALATATDRDSVAGGAQLDNLRTAMAKLSPTAQNFAKYIFGLRDAFYKLRGAADPVLAGIQTALESLLGKTSQSAQKNLAPVFDFVHRVAEAVGQIAINFANLLKGPTFTRFFDYISKTAVPMLDLLDQMFENVLVGVINLFLAFTPLTDQVGGDLLDLTKRFRDWSNGLETNQGFQNLIGFIRKSWPQVGHFLGEFLQLIGKIVEAAGPVGSVVVDIFTGLFDVLNRIPRKTLEALVGGIAAAAAAITIFAGATAVLSLDLPGLIAGGIALLVAAFATLAGSTDGLGQVFGQVWGAIQDTVAAATPYIQNLMGLLSKAFDDTVSVVKDFWFKGVMPVVQDLVAFGTSLYEALSPAFSSIGGLFTQLGQWVFMVYDQVILPVAKGFFEVWKTVFAALRPVFEVLGTVIGTLAAIIIWLLDKVVLPVVNGITWLLIHVLTPAFKFVWAIAKPIIQVIGVLLQVLAAIVKVAIGLMMIQFKLWGLAFKFVYDHVIKPIWDALVENVFKPLGQAWNKHVKPYWDAFVGWLGKRMSSIGRQLGFVAKIFLHYVLNEGILKGYNWLADKFNINPRNVHINEPSGDWYTKSSAADFTRLRRGGPVRGPGTKDSDSIPALLSNGEHVLTADEVAAAGGHGAIYAWRRQLLRNGSLFQLGGAVGDGFGDWLKKTAKSIGKKATDAFDSTVDFLKNPVKSLTDLAKGLYDKMPAGVKENWFAQRLLALPNKILDGLKEKVTGLFGAGADGFSGMLGGAKGGQGWQWEVATVEAAFPHTQVYSTFRPGAVTLSGNRSYHAIGRAVDFAPRREVAEWIARTYGKNTLELITPWRDLMLWHGKPHKYSRAIEAQHGVFGNNAHIHWAYDKGGLLPDTRNMPGGVMQVFHGSKLPDKVLTDDQWRSMATLAAAAQDSAGAGNTYQFEFRDTTLDPSRLRALQDREAVLSRQGRAR